MLPVRCFFLQYLLVPPLFLVMKSDPGPVAPEGLLLSVFSTLPHLRVPSLRIVIPSVKNSAPVLIYSTFIAQQFPQCFGLHPSRRRIAPFFPFASHLVADLFSLPAQEELSVLYAHKSLVDPSPHNPFPGSDLFSARN